MADAPRISIVIPIYNEEAILHAAVVDLRERLKPLGWSYEIILAENGSKDRTVELARTLAEKYAEVRFITAGAPDYGKALREGLWALDTVQLRDFGVGDGSVHLNRLELQRRVRPAQRQLERRAAAPG